LILVSVVEVEVVVLIGEGFLKDLTEDLGLLGFGLMTWELKKRFLVFFCSANWWEGCLFPWFFSCWEFEPSYFLKCFHFRLDGFGEKVEKGFQGGLLKVTAGRLDGGDCAVLGLIWRTSMQNSTIDLIIRPYIFKSRSMVKNTRIQI